MVMAYVSLDVYFIFKIDHNVWDLFRKEEAFIELREMKSGSNSS